MPDYDPDSPPADDALLPHPETVPEGTGEFGNLMLQVVAGAQVLAGVALFVAWVLGAVPVVAIAAAVLFVGLGVFLFATVANARLSDRFRSEEYRRRLRAVGIEDGRRPDFLPVEDGELVVPEGDGDGAGRDAAPGEGEAPAPDAS